jgi:uncharacterized protein YkwD
MFGLLLLSVLPVDEWTMIDTPHPYMQWMLDSNNHMRGNRRPHVLNEQLCRAAQHQATAMAVTQNYSHGAGGGSSLNRAMLCGFRGNKVSENIAKNAKWPDGKLAFCNPWESWRASGPHYSTIIGDSTQVGFGWATDVNGITYWCAVYGR